MKLKKVLLARIYLILLGLVTFMALGFSDVVSGRIAISDMFSADLASSFLEAAGIIILVGFVYFVFTLQKYVNSSKTKILKIFLVAVVIIEILDNCYRYYAMSPYLSESFLNIYFLASLVLVVLLYATINRSFKK